MQPRKSTTPVNALPAMTPHHIQALQNTYPEYTMYYPTIPKCSKLTRYRPMSGDQRRLSRQPFNPLPSIRGLSKRQQKDRIRNHLAAQETNRSRQMMALALQPPPVPTRLSRTVPSPHRLRHKSQPRRRAPRAQHTIRMAQAPAAIAATSVPAAPPAHIVQLQKNTQRVRFFLPKAAPPREGVG